MSALDKISSVDMLERLITNDRRWTWILDEWEASSDETLLSLAETVRRFRANFVTETATLVSKLLGDISGPEDVKRATQEQEREPEPSPDGSLSSWQSAGSSDDD